MLNKCIVCNELRGEIVGRRREEKDLERLKVKRALLAKLRVQGEEEMANNAEKLVEE